mmetsp:Transcript_13046/g.30193  ORF Transcript_13046/g.30193 Transcript_13046/m.30193 type:complete len:207 (-) Transcript_13046:34-654(-)
MRHNPPHLGLDARFELIRLDVELRVEVLWAVESREALVHEHAEVGQLVLVHPLLQLELVGSPVGADEGVVGRSRLLELLHDTVVLLGAVQQEVLQPFVVEILDLRRAVPLGTLPVRDVVGHAVVLRALAELALDHVRVQLLGVGALDELALRGGGEPRARALVLEHHCARDLDGRRRVVALLRVEVVVDVLEPYHLLDGLVLGHCP